MRLILASRSPRRADLLRAAGYEFDVCETDVDESVRPNESPADYVQRLASAKSAAVAAGLEACTTDDRTTDGVAQPFPPSLRFGVARRSANCGGGRPAREIIVGADTAVVVDGLILGKPADDNDAAAMLRRLSGRRHEVLTGLSVRSGGRELKHVETTAVLFAELRESDLAWYIESGEGSDKAGGYAIQGLASRFIPRIEGSYSNVVGLPIAALCPLIARLEADHT